MKKYTQSDFDNFEVDENGYKICPSGDYTQISSFGSWCRFGDDCSFSAWCSFGEGCSFGAWCSFGEECSFGEKCSFENGAVKNGRYVAVDRIGSANRKAYFFMDEDGKMFIRTGCWFSDMAAFKAACDFAELMLKGDNGQ